MSEIDTSAEAVERLAVVHDRDAAANLMRNWVAAATFHERTAATLRALAAERDTLRAAWLAVIQAENSCVHASGAPCHAKRCGCACEQEEVIREWKEARHD